MYEFNTKDEEPTVKIRMLPHRYVRIKVDGEERLLQLGTDYEPDPATGMRRRVWVAGRSGEMWVPDRIAKELTMPGPDDAKHGCLPVAEVTETRPAGRPRRQAEAPAPAE